jgi:pimeloyl-ACP methyl ester carboxylesterase
METSLNTESKRTVTRGDATFSYLEQGTGTPLVLLHGVGSAARSWNHQLDALSGRLRVIAWDAPGYGSSTALSPAAPDAGDYAAALHDFVGALGLDRFHLVGHSLGCVMGARYAKLHPERILSLTLASIATGHARLPETERQKLRAGRLDDLAALGARGMAEKRGPRLLGPNATVESIRAVVETMAMIRPDGYTQAVRMLSGADTRADVRELPADMRVQFIYGDADVITTPEQNQSVHRERPGAPVHVLPGAGHACYIEQPEAFNTLVAEWVSD